MPPPLQTPVPADFANLPPNVSMSYIDALNVLSPPDAKSLEADWQDLTTDGNVTSLPREWNEWKRFEKSRLFVEILEGRELKSAYPNGTCDPYVLVEFFSSLFLLFVIYY
jgi:hypothetical protein